MFFPKKNNFIYFKANYPPKFQNFLGGFVKMDAFLKKSAMRLFKVYSFIAPFITCFTLIILDT